MLEPSKGSIASKQEDGAANLRNRGLALRAGRSPCGCTPAASPWSTPGTRYPATPWSAAGSDRLASVARPRLFQTSYAAAQPGLFGLDEAGWLKAIRC